MRKLYDNLNEQMNYELESAYIYATMSAYLNDLNMKGMAHFIDQQVKEEMEHAKKNQKFPSVNRILHKISATKSWKR